MISCATSFARRVEVTMSDVLLFVSGVLLSAGACMLTTSWRLSAWRHERNALQRENDRLRNALRNAHRRDPRTGRILPLGK
jgi:hypothetical protein